MFGIAQERLINGLEILRKQHCAYMTRDRHSMCDCKFGVKDARIPCRGESGGCPELAQAQAMLETLDYKGFNKLAGQADVILLDRRAAAQAGGQDERED